MADSTIFYDALRQFKTSNKITVEISKQERKKILRTEGNFILKDGQLFYTGPSKQYMRLVVQSEEQKQAVLQECHGNPGTGNHSGFRSTRDRVVSGYYWSTISEDVKDWVKRCHLCQLNDPIKTVAPALHPIKVKEPWEVVGMDLIGPLQETANKNQYILTMTDLYTKWVVAEALQTKSATEVATAVVKKLYLFGMVRKIITDQGREFVNTLNSKIFEALNIKHAVSSAYHPQTNGQDERTNQNIKRALRKYVNEEHNDWDVHLQAIVYGLNTAKQRSTAYSPYYLLFHRHPRLPEVMNACPMEDTMEVGDPGDDLERTLAAVKALNTKVRSNIERAQEQQKKAFSGRKRKRERQCHLEAGDKVLIGECPKKRKLGPTLQSRHKGPFTLTALSDKGVATVSKGNGKLQTITVSRLRPYYEPKENRKPKTVNLVDHSYAASATLAEHQYASHGPQWFRDCGAVQNELLNYVLDRSRPAPELIVLEGKICLTREDFWSLGLQQYMESNIGNACFLLIQDAATRHGMDIHVMDLYAVPTWKMGNIQLPENLGSKDAILIPAWSRQDGAADHYMLCVILVRQREIVFLDSLCPQGFGDEAYRTIFRQLAETISPGPWTEKTGMDFSSFPHQAEDGTCCGVFMLMYALCICTGSPFDFTERDIPSIRRWWCIELLQRFSIEGHGQRFAGWTKEAEALLAGRLEPVFRVPRKPLNPLKEEPKIIRDLYLAVQWIRSNPGLFRGQVKEPTFLAMEEEDQQEALRVAQEEEDLDAKDPFLFVFERMEDMEVFLTECWDEQGLHVNTLCTNPHTPLSREAD